MVEIARALRDVLVPTLLTAFAGIVLSLGFVIAQRLVLTVMRWRRTRVLDRYRPALQAALASDGPEAEAAVRALRRVPARHRPIMASAILEPLRVVQGTTVDRARRVAAEMGLLAAWQRGLTRGRRSRRARAALAVGLLRDRSSVPVLITLLDSPQDEVRAAAVDALGLIGDVSALEALLPRVGQQSRHQQARLVEALRRIGPAVTASIVQRGVQESAERRVMADVLALVGGTGARATLLRWTTDGDPAVRAASWRAIGVTGMDDRSGYHALRAMSDPDARVRAQAAQALGRTGRTDFVPYLAQHLDDEWEVAAQGARALARMGNAGHAALQARAASGAGGHGLELARHFLWEQGRP